MIPVAQLTSVMKTLADPDPAGGVRAHRRRTRNRGNRADEGAEGIAAGRVAASARAARRRPRDGTEGGRHIYYRPAPKGLAPLFDWLNHYQAFWRERFENLEEFLKEESDE